MSTKLPEFERPPVVEVAISVQFNAPVLDGPQVMLRWSEIRGRFPRYQVAPPLPRSIERFDGPQAPEFEIQFGNAPITPQLLMMTQTGEEALQLQENRIGYTWRKLNQEGVYPRYSRIREIFQGELENFRTYIRGTGLDTFSPVQCELAYVDALLPQPGIWGSHSELGKVIPSVAPGLTKGLLPPSEETNFTTTFVIPDDSGNSWGRLHVTVEPRFLSPDQIPMYLMTTRVRGAPKGGGTSDIFHVLDTWHSWILRAFVDLTSPEMHHAWGITS